MKNIILNTIYNTNSFSVPEPARSYYFCIFFDILKISCSEKLNNLAVLEQTLYFPEKNPTMGEFFKFLCGEMTLVSGKARNVAMKGIWKKNLAKMCEKSFFYSQSFKRITNYVNGAQRKF